MSRATSRATGKEPTRQPGTPRPRLQFRATPAQRRVLRQAAATTGKSMNAFVLDTACAAAYELLAERPDFLMDDPDWEHFLGLLDQPTSEKDRLKALLAGPA